MSEGPMTSEEMMNPNRQIIHSIKQIESDLSRVYISLEKPDPSKYINQKYQINRTYEQPVRTAPGSNYGGRQPESAVHSQFQPSYISAGKQSMNGEEFPPESFIPGMMYEEAFDEKVVPMHNKDPIDFSKVKDDKGKPDQQIGGEIEEEKFSQQDKAKIEIMSQYFKPETVKQLLSKNWQSRRKGLESFIKEIPTSMKEHGIAVQEHAINVFFPACKEKLSQLSELAMKLFEVILEESKKWGFELKFDSNKTSAMIAEILDKKEMDIIKNKILTGGYFDFNIIASFILSDKSYLNKKFANSEKHIQTRLELIIFMLETSEQYTSKRSFPMKELLEYVFNKFSHGNKQIRSQTQKVITLISIILELPRWTEFCQGTK